MVLDAERNGTELLKQVRLRCGGTGPRTCCRRRRNGRRCGPRSRAEAEAESRRQREQAEQHLDETAEFIVERVVKH